MNSEEAPMNWNKWIRQAHRWLAVAFTATVVIVTVVVVSQEEPAVAVTLMPLLPLAFLLFTGLYLFLLPYALKRRRSGPAE
jgi:hypothetical protein